MNDRDSTVEQTRCRHGRSAAGRRGGLLSATAVTANIKNFVEIVDTPDGERAVVYTAVESARVRTEVSGIAQLENGRAVVELPDRFGYVVNDEEPLVVQVTPYGGPGLRVVERTTDHIVVEPVDGRGNHEFAYTVKGVRKGYEEFEVVRSVDSVADSRHHAIR